MLIHSELDIVALSLDSLKRSVFSQEYLVWHRENENKLKKKKTIPG